MNPDDDTSVPYTSPMHLGKVVGRAMKGDENGETEKSEQVTEIERRIAELEIKSVGIGIAGKFQIEQSLAELRHQRSVLLGEIHGDETSGVEE